MKIEIALPQRFSQSGKSLLRLIQNNDMPTLDLLVRESVQNSLDAWNECSKNVTVEFNIGKFKSNYLSNELEGITEALNMRYGESNCSFVSVGDSNTYGLTGDISDPNSEEGNLQKLIYQICHAQESEGAGGSWGIGKTVYFRVGIGLVIYYSRIKLENGNYESRMAATLVEDETKDEALIPQYGNNKKRGIAWWGDQIDENLTIATTNEEDIIRILNIFGIEPYDNEKTGTTIIIPYINEEKLLNDNISEYSDSINNKIDVVWTRGITAYLKIAIQRWYATRLNNLNYIYGPYLKVYINNNLLGNIDPDETDIEPLFQIIQSLYNRAVNKDSKYNDILSSLECNVIPIQIRGPLVESCSGNVAFVKVDNKMLKMTPPINKYNPYVYLNKEEFSKDSNRPIICYTRKPGMIVSYESVGEWTDGIVNTDREHYIIGIFVLNSKNKLKVSDISLEEYVRQSELADHTSWTDINIKNNNPRIVARIKKNVAGKIAKAYAEVIKEDKTTINNGYGKFFGDLILPPENFGKLPTKKEDSTKSASIISKHRDIIMTMKNDGVRYCKDGLNIDFEVQSKSPIDYVKIENLVIASEVGEGISIEEWTNLLGLDLPIELSAVQLVMNKWEDNEDVDDICRLDENMTGAMFKDFSCTYLKTIDGINYGIELQSEKAHKLYFSGTFHLQVLNNNAKVSLGIYTKRGDK